MNPAQLFQLFFDYEVIELMINRTNTYAHVDCNDQLFQTNCDEIRKFIGILLFTGMVELPITGYYWFDNVLKMENVHVVDNVHLTLQKNVRNAMFHFTQNVFKHTIHPKQLKIN